MKKILFQGDSITYAYRCEMDDNNTGNGYPTLVKGELEFEYPNQYKVYNRGIGGNRIVDLYARIKSDIINMEPDIISILIGVNDVWEEIEHQKGVDTDKFFTIYSMLIEEIKEALPDVKIILMEPFILEAEGTENTEECPNKWEWFNTEIKKNSEKVQQIARKYGLQFIPLQEKFNEAAKLASNEYWLRDGVHPTTAGHELIKREWLKYFRELK